MFGEAVAYELEYALADGAAALAAKALGKSADEEHFTRKSQSYRRLWDKESGFIRGVDSTGCFREPFNPTTLRTAPMTIARATPGNTPGLCHTM